MPRFLSLLTALVVAFSLSARELEPPKADEKWITFDTDGFRFISSASPRATQDIARDILRMRAALAKVTKLEVRTERPTRVYIFPSERRFATYREAALDVKNDAVTGVFVTSSSGGNFILLDSSAESVDRVVYHELTHQFVQNTSAGLPLWFNEGLAEYYSTFQTVGDQTLIGRAVQDHVRWLRFQFQSLIPLRELFATTSSSPTYTEGDRHGIFYAQSWALVHYLMTDPARRTQLGRFLTLLDGGKSVDEAFSGAFGMKFAELEQALRTYILGVSFQYNSYALADIAIDELPEPAAMPHDEVLHQLGYLLAHSRAVHAGTAERFFKEALAANPRNAGVYAELGRLYESAGRSAEAGTAYEKAVQLGTSDAAVYLLAGNSVLRRDPARARAYFQQATKLDPESAPAWSGLGSTYVSGEGDRAAGIAALEKSLALAPGNDEATFYLAQLYAHASRFEEARKLARAVLARTKDEPMQRHLTTMLAQVDRFEAQNRALSAINDAVTKANSGRYQEALVIIDRVLPTIEDAELQQQTRALREQVASQVKPKKK
ncbi:MAG TPA: tetratricopeptide repeat protein [Thermoanaerobaculia bacterium]|nr:tetratricopeptide repeat protein [Thermoanaerobaculia bacterium]